MTSPGSLPPVATYEADRKSTRLKSSHFPYTTHFRSVIADHEFGGKGVQHRELLRTIALHDLTRIFAAGCHVRSRSEEHTSEIQSLPLHDALPICYRRSQIRRQGRSAPGVAPDDSTS